MKLNRRKKSEQSTMRNGQNAKEDLLRRIQEHKPITPFEKIKELFEKARNDAENNSFADDEEILFLARRFVCKCLFRTFVLRILLV